MLKVPLNSNQSINHQIFRYNRWESVTELQYLCGELPFECLCDLSRWNFLNDMQSNGINSAIDIIENSIDILRVKYGWRGSNLVAI